MNRFVFTCGDINGIGPEVAIKALSKIHTSNNQNQFILIIPKNTFDSTSKIVSPKFDYKVYSRYHTALKSSEQVVVLTLKSARQNKGKPTIESGKAAFKALQISFQLIDKQGLDAVVTAPVSKTALNLSGVKYPGQTEMFADWCGVKNFVMTFLSKQLRVALYSIHIPLKEVTNYLQQSRLQSKLRILISMLKNDLGIIKPKIAVLGINPHAGENGIIGQEERALIEPAINQKEFKGMVEGPFSPDVFFANRRFKNYDLVFGFYHDQVLIPFKYINSGKGVNFSAGLPIIRTSPDHGVAYDIAGQGIADESSMVEAFKYAKLILKNRSASNLV